MDHSRASWVFVIGTEAKPPDLRCVTFNKRLKEYFKHSGFGWIWSWETAGGKNILVDPEDFPSVLERLPFDMIREGRLPTISSSSKSRSSNNYFQREAELESELVRLLRSEPNQVPHLDCQRRFSPNSAFEPASIPDIIIEEAGRVLIVELKLHEAGEVEISQIQRYLSNKDLAQAYAGKPRMGILVADRFTEEARRIAAETPEISLCRYRQCKAGSVSLEEDSPAFSIGRYI